VVLGKGEGCRVADAGTRTRVDARTAGRDTVGAAVVAGEQDGKANNLSQRVWVAGCNPDAAERGGYRATGSG